MKKLIQYSKQLLRIGMLVSLTSCASHGSYAPVTDASNQVGCGQSIHVVRKGETLYAIAWRYGQDFRDIAINNNIHPPYPIYVGEKIRLMSNFSLTNDAPLLTNTTKFVTHKYKEASSIAGQSGIAAKDNDFRPLEVSRPATTTTMVTHSATSATIKTTKVFKPAKAPPAIVATPTDQINSKAVLLWRWPSQGKVISHFSSAVGGNKGVDIIGSAGQPVAATAAGKVVYCGNGLRGYGELIIIKHNEVFLSAYAHNQKLLVRDGQAVKAGQVIALMGDTEANRILLHFEIRRAGKPVDPMQYLPTK